MLGKLLDSLSYRIEKNLEESIYKNETFLDNKWNKIEELIIIVVRADHRKEVY